MQRINGGCGGSLRGAGRVPEAVVDGVNGRVAVDLRAVTRSALVEERLTHAVIGAFFEVYNTLGFGFLEHVYVMALERELVARDHRVAREVGVRVIYKGVELATQRLDMIVDDAVVVEAKSAYELHRAAPRQVYNYLRATGLEVGLLLHFGPEPKFYRLMCRNTPHTAE